MSFDELLSDMRRLANTSKDPKTQFKLHALTKEIEKNGLDGVTPDDIGLSDKLSKFADELFDDDRVDYAVYDALKDL